MIRNKIVKILKNSIAEELELQVGDVLLSVNGAEVQDYIDYKFQISDDFINIDIEKPDGEIWEFEIEKEYDEDLGIIFENPLMDNIKVCENNCVFCFIDQMPRGMRKTLYLKDDDTRLSFLYGNFITLTNLTDDEINRIIQYRISPIKVSVHATDLMLRNELMGKKNGKDVMIYLKRLADNEITVDCQIVLCRGLNDEKVLEKTIEDLSDLYPYVRSVAVVPVGLTDFRENLYKLNKFDYESSLGLIEQVKTIQSKMLNKLTTRFIFIADEFYILSKSEFPNYDEYEDFDQIENGIGLYRLLEREVDEALKEVSHRNSTCLDDLKKLDNGTKTFTIVTGVAAYEIMKELSEKISAVTGIKINTVKIINECFGENITVSGLITGKDIIKQLEDKGFSNLIIPKVMVEHEEEIFLDDTKIEEIENKLNTKVYVCNVNGKEFVDLLLRHA